MDGEGYREAALPGAPWQTKYPPGYPAMLAAVLSLNLAHRDFWVLAHSWLWLAVASATLAWALTRAGLAPIQASVAAALWTANPAACLVGTNALSETPFCAVIFLAIGSVLPGERIRTRLAVLAGALVGIASMIRVAGVLVAVAIALWLVWRRHPKAALWFASCAMVAPTVWMLWSRAHAPISQDPVSSFYLDYTGRWLQAIHSAGLGTIIIKNLTYGVLAVGGLLIATKSLLLLRAVRDLVLIAFSFVALGDRPMGIFSAVAAVTAIFHAFWLALPEGRFLLLVSVPLLGALVIRFSRCSLPVRIGVLGVVLIADLYGIADLADVYRGQRTRLTQLEPAFAFIRAQVPASAVFLGDEQVWLRTGRRTVGLPMPMEYDYSGRLEAALEEHFLRYRAVARQFGAQYVMLTPWDLERNLREKGAPYFFAVRSDPGLERIFAANGIELFRIRE